MKQEKLTSDKPQAFVHKLTNYSTKEELLNLLTQLDNIISSTHTDWTREFVKLKGIDILFKIYLKYYSREK